MSKEDICLSQQMLQALATDVESSVEQNDEEHLVTYSFVKPQYLGNTLNEELLEDFQIKEKVNQESLTYTG